MKRSTKMGLGIVAVGLTLASASAVVVAQEKIAGQGARMMADAGHHGGGEHRRAGGMRQYMMQLFDEHDADKDGAVTQAEVDAVRKGKLDRFDTNKDGALSLGEFEALWLEQMKSRMVDSFQRLDDDGSGAISGDEFVAPFSHIIARHDMDKDGDVDKEEMSRHMRGVRGGYHKGYEPHRSHEHHGGGDHDRHDRG